MLTFFEKRCLSVFSTPFSWQCSCQWRLSSYTTSRSVKVNPESGSRRSKPSCSTPICFSITACDTLPLEPLCTTVNTTSILASKGFPWNIRWFATTCRCAARCISRAAPRRS